MAAEPDTFWTSMETITWGKQQLRPKFKPGKGFHYSDTNYELLGLIIEKITGMKFHEALHQFIFTPLEMNNTCLLFHSESNVMSAYLMADLYYKGLNLSKAKSISMSCAAVGILRGMSLLILRRFHPKFFLKTLGEITARSKSNLFGHFGHAKARLQQLRSLFQPHRSHKFRGRLSGYGR